MLEVLSKQIFVERYQKIWHKHLTSADTPYKKTNWLGLSCMLMYCNNTKNQNKIRTHAKESRNSFQLPFSYDKKMQMIDLCRYQLAISKLRPSVNGIKWLIIINIMKTYIRIIHGGMKYTNDINEASLSHQKISMND